MKTLELYTEAVQFTHTLGMPEELREGFEETLTLMAMNPWDFIHHGLELEMFTASDVSKAIGVAQPNVSKMLKSPNLPSSFIASRLYDFQKAFCSVKFVKLLDIG
jgi:hypothetical protein